MFYEPKKKNHNLAKNPFNSLILPRPIGWISSASKAGVFNLAPYSFFNAVCYQPPTVMFSGGVGAHADGMKDTVRNILDTGEFVCNLATWENREAMNQSSANVASDVDEFRLTGLTPTASTLVGVPRVIETPVNLECRFIKSVDIPGWQDADNYIMILGEVVGVHIDDSYITEEGLVDIRKMMPIGRLGYDDYARVDEQSIFSMTRPK
ncbi:MAG: flavin reductase (DIM6/NTAB) family NADH-FMN oxidoreductase RutF [Pseudohongiellaceae bacterium]|jgi:flavin reductase (DIM6/NTAB) family NADH-FMN oxidoreductase RutF